MLLLLSLLPSGPAIKATESQDQRDSIFWKKEKLGARASSPPPQTSCELPLGHFGTHKEDYDLCSWRPHDQASRTSRPSLRGI